MKRYKTSEYVGIGHPDKIADQISDTILDLYLQEDRNSRVAIETLVSGNKIFLAGEITSKAFILEEDIKKSIRKTLDIIGYGPHVPGDFRSDNVDIQIFIKPQSLNISGGVDKKDGQVGAGDQGIMFGYANKETPEMLPIPYVIAADLLNTLNHQVINRCSYLRGFYTDNKSQVCASYNDEIKSIDKIILSCWHDENIDLNYVREVLTRQIIFSVLNNYRDLINIGDNIELLVNSAGPFYIGGPTADAGLTGRKIIVDTYGGFAKHGGGAFSGKDPSKVDRSATYMARHVAKSLVANGYAKEVTVQLSYAIGHTQPFSIDVKAVSDFPERDLIQLVRDNFDLSPRGIIEYLELNNPEKVTYRKVASMGHFLNPEYSWEKIKKL